jgi:hypothetical protein
VVVELAVMVLLSPPPPPAGPVAGLLLLQAEPIAITATAKTTGKLRARIVVTPFECGVVFRLTTGCRPRAVSRSLSKA